MVRQARAIMQLESTVPVFCSPSVLAKAPFWTAKHRQMDNASGLGDPYCDVRIDQDTTYEDLRAKVSQGAEIWSLVVTHRRGDTN